MRILVERALGAATRKAAVPTGALGDPMPRRAAARALAVVLRARLALP